MLYQEIKVFNLPYFQAILFSIFIAHCQKEKAEIKTEIPPLKDQQPLALHCAEQSKRLY